MVFHGGEIRAIRCAGKLGVIGLDSERRVGPLGLDVYLALLFLCRFGSTLNIKSCLVIKLSIKEIYKSRK